MEDAYAPFNCHYQQQDQWKLAHFYSMLELETSIASAHKEIAKKSDQVLNFNCLLTKILNERDELRFKCRILSQRLIQHETKIFEDNASFVRAPQEAGQIELRSELQPTPLLPPPHVLDNVLVTKRLPEKGKLLQAMMDAGPLLQTLLSVGTLPRWRNAPPKLDVVKIPTIATRLPSTTTRQVSLHQDSYVRNEA